MKLFHDFKIPFTFYKFFEISFHWRTNLCSWFEFNARIREKCDHAGFYFIFSFLKLFLIEINIYDNRHWDEHHQQYFNSQALFLEKQRAYLLTPKFMLKEAETLLTEIEELREKINSVFSKYDQALVNDCGKEINLSLDDVENWLKKATRKW